MPYTFGSPRREWMGTRLLAEQAFSRAAGAPLLSGNSVTLLRDATQNYPRWLEAIGAARERICFENYIIQPDAVGQQFAAALAEKARSGVRVRLIYDWLGSLSLGSRAFWRRLTEAGVEVRCFNPPRLDSPLGWVSREHRKSIAIDGRVGFVSGICISRRWLGSGGEPWRDTGLEIRGPAVADIERAFAEVWALLGPPIPAAELARRDGAEQNAGGVDLRVVATAPSSAGLFRLDQLIAALARKRLWLADAYFVGASTYVQALCAAATDGVDVRLLVPGTSDLPLLTPLSRAGYRPLLEAGIRVFEWNGPMMHAKTAVADGRWARVGSSNLNIASWIGNYELDVTVENEAFAREMEHMYLEDLERSTEVVLQQRRPRRALSAVPPRAR
ncbi:MAG TPA: phospholipase D-like domain-containing protein, partial [Candidatus Competibacteraceae bacterium]|nr:phospholipase D-like domain-containing protein [Candidatus Competibacteraceae bacterium]